MNFINNNPEKSSLVIKKNDKYIYSHNHNKKFKVASLYKLIVAIEAQRQANIKEIDLNQRISISKIEKYNYMPKTNVKYEKWKDSLRKNTSKPTIRQIIEGMINYSSNPNTDFLIDYLGEEKVNELAMNLTNENHSYIYKSSSSLAIPIYLKEEKNYKDSQIKKIISESNKKKYKKLIKNTEVYLENNSNSNALSEYFPSEPMQKIWANNLPESSASAYINIFNKSKMLYGIDASHIERLINKKHENNSYYIEKTGKAINIENKVIYLNKNNTKYELLILTNDIDDYEKLKISNNINSFLKGILNNEYKLGKSKKL
ncbi:serine hydrolase [Staphylococcus haemolyticus]|uniref:serine hydrolase n=1 Tax=Staphylococcus haemolyticus TaxID=1283 RepID=UPI0028889C8F|nr:serine hydrolase [Staphylococcus haemolyticus]MDT0739108.1 serine hydrolase [Staphylococcus haemolyticus]